MLPEVIAFTIDALTLAAGGQRATYPLRVYDEDAPVEVYTPAYKAGRVLSSANLKRIDETIAMLQ